MKRKIVTLLMIVMAGSTFTACGQKVDISPAVTEKESSVADEVGDGTKMIMESTRQIIEDNKNMLRRADEASIKPLLQEALQYDQYSWYFDGTIEEFVENLSDEYYDRLKDICINYQEDILRLISDRKDSDRNRISFSAVGQKEYVGCTIKDLLEAVDGIKVMHTYMQDNEVRVAFDSESGEVYTVVVKAPDITPTLEYEEITDYNTSWEIEYCEKYADDAEFENALTDFFADWYEYTDDVRFKAALDNDKNYQAGDFAEGSYEWWLQNSIEYYYKYSAPVDTEDDKAYFAENSHRQWNKLFNKAAMYIGRTPSDLVAFDDFNLVMGGLNSGFEQEGFLFNNDEIVYICVPYVEGSDEEYSVVYAESMRVTRDNLVELFESTPYVVDSMEVTKPGEAVIKLSLSFDLPAYLVINYPTSYAEAPELIDQLNLLARFNSEYIIDEDHMSDFYEYWNSNIEKLFGKATVNFIYDDYAKWTEDHDYSYSYEWGMAGYRGNYTIADFGNLSEMIVGQPR